MDKLLVFFVGSCFGSFANAVVLRIENNENFINVRSKCPKCGKTLSFYELTPIFSYLLLKGRCKWCKEKISIRYLLCEVFLAIVFLTIYLNYDFYLAILYNLFSVVLFMIALIDFDTLEIPNGFFTILLMLSFLIVINKGEYLDSFMGLVSLAVPLSILAKITKSIGDGDIILVAIGGLAFGHYYNIFSFVLALLLACLFSLYPLIKKENTMKSIIPFCPYLCFSYYLCLLIGKDIIEWYLFEALY